MDKTEIQNTIPLITGQSSAATVFIYQTVGYIIHIYIILCSKIAHDGAFSYVFT